MTEQETHGAHHHEELHAPPGNGKYIAVFVALCVLTAISFGIGNSPLMDTKSIGWTGMMTVSCAKAMLVILFFMHLKWEANWKYVLTIPATMMSIFLLLMLVPDVGRRTEKYTQARWLHAAEPRVEPTEHSEYEHGGDEEGPRSDGHSQ